MNALKTVFLFVALLAPFSMVYGETGVLYDIDENNSFLEIVEGAVPDGTWFADTIDVRETVPGSLVAGLAGQLVATQSGSTLSFSGGSEIDALRNNALAPGQHFDPDPSSIGSPGQEDNFGGLGIIDLGFSGIIVADLALRDTKVDILSGSFDIGSPANDLVFDVTSGVLDYLLNEFAAGLVNAEPVGTIDLSDQLSQVQNQSFAAVSEAPDGTLTIPFDLLFPFALPQFDQFGDPIPNLPNDSQLVLTGQIVASPVVLSPGDANGDGVVDLLDLDILGANFGMTNAQVEDGDFNGDGVVDLLDLDILGMNFTSSSVSVPEPQSLLILAAGLLLALRRAAD